MRTEITRPIYERSGRRYASDSTNAEWSHIAPLLPAAKRGGRPRKTDLRDVFDAICTWYPRAVSGACCRTTSRQSPQYAGISKIGATTVFCERSTIIF